MRRIILAGSGALALAACGGGSDGGSAAVPVVSATATPTPPPTPTPTPTPTATPTPTPTSSYTRFADLAGEQTFQTACASLVLGTGLPTPQPAAAFGDSLTLAHTAASDWSVTGDGLSLSFAAGNAVSAPAGQAIYQQTVSGSLQQLTIAAPTAAGTTLGYTRTLALLADRTAGRTLYSCVFGVPSLSADVPAAATSYAKVAVTGTVYFPDASGTVQAYALTGSTATASVDPGSGRVNVTIHLLGNLQTASGTSTTSTDFGTFTGSGTIDAARVRFAGSLDSANRISLFSSFTGAFFGGSEAGAAFEVLAVDTASGNRLAVVGSLAAGN